MCLFFCWLAAEAAVATTETPGPWSELGVLEDPQARLVRKARRVCRVRPDQPARQDQSVLLALLVLLVPSAPSAPPA